MSTTATTARDQAIVDQWVADLHSGAVFARAAMGHRSRFGYQPPATATRYSAILAGLARLAAQGDQAASVAAALIPRVNLYGTDAQQAAALFDGLVAVTAQPWEDVIGASGPEAGRPSSHQHAWSTRMLVNLYGIVCGIAEPGRGAGWVEALVRQAEGMAAR